MSSARRALAVLLALCGLVALAPASASAADRRVPRGFLGSVVDPALGYAENPLVVDQQYGVMASHGVESIRTNFNWDTANPAPGKYNWVRTDYIMAAAARHGLDVLPIVEFTPPWASSQPANHGHIQPPADYGTFGTFMTAAVQRYGPNGSFWTEHPELKRAPIRSWQIWNEPAGVSHWLGKPWQSTYSKLLAAASQAVHAADPGAKVVLGAVVGLNTTTLTPWKELSDLYAQGDRRLFDVVSVNAFTNAEQGSTAKAAVDRNLMIYDRVRKVMRRHGDAKKAIWNTEVTWTAALGRIPKSKLAGFETTPKGQAQRLTAYFKRAAADKTYGIKRVYWYTWFSPYTVNTTFGNIPTFQYAGLTQHAAPGQPFKVKPLLTTFANLAASLEGCRKTDNARTCK